jgi:hypothetical protein
VDSECLLGFPKGSQVDLADQFEVGTYDNKKPKSVCPPVNKNGEGILDPLAHYKRYLVKLPIGLPKHERQTVLMQDQYGDHILQTIKTDSLLVPTAKSLTSPPQPLTSDHDHYKCYKVKEVKKRCTGDLVTKCKTDTDCEPVGGICDLGFPAGVFADLDDQFMVNRAEVKKPKLLCTPVSKDGATVVNSTDHLVAYLIKAPLRIEVAGVFLDNQFGLEAMTTIKEEYLFVPASKVRVLRELDATTLEGKVLLGYQGWFSCIGDGSLVNDRWFHWGGIQGPTAFLSTFDFWPDTTELDPDELCITQMTFPDTTPAAVYSVYNEKTVARHFAWMKSNGLDGVLLQRFSSELGDPRFFDFRNKVTQNVRAGAERHSRVYAIMYDISGQNAATLVNDLKQDWTYLVDTLRVTESHAYLRHRGKPVLGIWGLGFGDRPATPAQGAELIAYFHSGADPRYQASLVGGVPTYWRTLTNDSSSDPAWADVYRSFDVIEPWSVGRYGDDAGADLFQQNLIIPDLAEAGASGVEYMPVVFPGFSWHNLTGGPLNEIPRNGGRFLWRQVFNAVSAGATMIRVAMFDEVDEGTAIFKTAPTAAEMPAQGSFVPLNIDGEALPSDWYLQLTGEAGKMLRGEIPLSPNLPIAP